MKILFVDFTLPYLLHDAEYPVGGWAIQLQSWLKGLLWNKVNVGVLTRKGGKKISGAAHKFEILDTYDPDRGIKILKYFYSYIPTLYRTAKLYRPDAIIQACSGLNTGIMAFIATRLKIPFYYRVTNDMDTDDRYKNRLRLYERWAYRSGLNKAKAIICQNQYQKDCLQKWFPQKPLYILHNPFDIFKDLPCIRHRDKRKYIAWLAVFSSQKNMGLLLEIAKRMPDIEFRVAGSPSRTIDTDTTRSVNQLKKLNNVKFVGYIKRKDVFEFLSQAVGLLSTSHYEGFSNTYLESMAVGTPIIAPLRVDPDLIITNNHLGLTAKFDENLYRKVKMLWQMDTDGYQIMCTKCREYLFNNHHPKIKAKELLNILESDRTKNKKEAF